jgi:tRNA (guanine37-N1)-methyltransferase
MREEKVDLCLDPKTWSTVLQEAVKAEDLKVIPYNLTLDYNYWTYRTLVRKGWEDMLSWHDTDDIMTSLLPEDAQDEIPVGFAIVGHVGMVSILTEEYF